MEMGDGEVFDGLKKRLYFESGKKKREVLGS